MQRLLYVFSLYQTFKLKSIRIPHLPVQPGDTHLRRLFIGNIVIWSKKDGGGQEDILSEEEKQRIRSYSCKRRTMFPHKIEELREDLNKELMNDFKGRRNRHCEVGEDKWILPFTYAAHAEKYYTFPLRKDDIWIVTYPRSGTTWTQEMIWLINNNVDIERSKNVPLMERFPFMEFNCLHNEEFIDEIINLNNKRPEVVEHLKTFSIPAYETLEHMNSPRHIKSHLPFSLLPPSLLDTCKVVYVARNPKDVAVSYYHHHVRHKINGYVGTFEKYWEYFERDLLVWSPYWKHLQEAWEKRNDANMLFLFYEELILDLPKCLRRLASFLNKEINEDDVQKLVEYLHIDNFRENLKLDSFDVEIEGLIDPTAQGFIRKGKIGGNEEFTEALHKRADEWMRKKLIGTDLKFPGI